MINDNVNELHHELSIQRLNRNFQCIYLC